MDRTREGRRKRDERASFKEQRASPRKEKGILRKENKQLKKPRCVVV